MRRLSRSQMAGRAVSLRRQRRALWRALQRAGSLCRKFVSRSRCGIFELTWPIATRAFVSGDTRSLWFSAISEY